MLTIGIGTIRYNIIAQKQPTATALQRSCQDDYLHSLTSNINHALDKHYKQWLGWAFYLPLVVYETSTSNPFLCAADFFLQLGSCKEAVR